MDLQQWDQFGTYHIEKICMRSAEMDAQLNLYFVKVQQERSQF